MTNTNTNKQECSNKVHIVVNPTDKSEDPKHVSNVCARCKFPACEPIGIIETNAEGVIEMIVRPNIVGK